MTVPVVFCLGPHRTDDGQTPPRAEAGWLCRRCYSRLSSSLSELPAVAAWLNVNIAPSPGAGEKISGTREDPIPLRQDVLDLIGPRARNDAKPLIENPDDQLGEPSIHATVVSWAKLVHDEAHADWPDRNDLVTIVGWLHAKLDWLSRQPWVDELIDEIGRLHRRARTIAPWDSERQRLVSDCPSCDMRSLVFIRGEGVRCETRLAGCGRTWVDEDFDRLILVLGHEALRMAE